MKYQPLFHIALLHEYYADGSCPDFQFHTDEETARMMRGCRLLMSPFGNGVTVLMAAEKGKPVIDIPVSCTFRFNLILQNDRFYRFTEHTPVAGEMPVFEHTTSGSALQPKSLAKKTPGVFGIVRVQPLAVSQSEATVFTLSFKARKTTWKYLLVTDDETPAAFRIEQRRNADDLGKMAFHAPADLSQVKDHPLCRLVESDFPAAKKVLIESQEAVPFFQRGRKGLQLKKDNVVLIDPLPVPCAEDNGMKVIKYFKNQKT